MKDTVILKLVYVDIQSGRKTWVDPRKDGETSTREEGTNQKLAYTMLTLLLIMVTEGR
jgi:hypothetical protein